MSRQKIVSRDEQFSIQANVFQGEAEKLRKLARLRGEESKNHRLEAERLWSLALETDDEAIAYGAEKTAQANMRQSIEAEAHQRIALNALEYCEIRVQNLIENGAELAVV